MLFIIAWKNIWRNKTRSLVVIISVMLGLWMGAFLLSYIFGMIDQRLKDAIGNEISHLQIHHPKHSDDHDPQYFIPKSRQLIADLEKNDSVKILSGRVLVDGMVASPAKSLGARIIGINVKKEDQLTQFAKNIVEGEFLKDSDKNKIIIGRKLADKLKVKLRNKVVLTFQDHEANIVAGAFRIKGIFKSYNSTLENNNLYVTASDLSNLLDISGEIHEIAILLNEADHVDPFVSQLRADYESLSIEGWKELAPELGLMIESLDQYMIIFLTIILLAISFGIVNTMLMAVLERVREIGMLMAIGMNSIRLFMMIFLETLLLVLVASPIGLLLAHFTISYLGEHGMDLSGIYQEGYASYGFKPIIYPKLETVYYLRIMVLVMITAVLASIYPAISAIRLDPVKAIRKI
ncbi:FtsX-like permease family protein [Fulvivirgaceae bacterium BMA10]|uniref:FtsX-like permease family protein n=1 Tax=Splendidivirga corallicola TaxID=3051826 RepID=A0ABT8KT33_9BACT|nr:FtsX-like permease family protein [Fulvivirgaceae bacterium BMA10]